MTTQTATLYVIEDADGRVDQVNDDIRQPAIYVSRAHAGRVIKWIGLTGRTVREATEDEIAAGFFVAAHCVPDWSPAKTPSRYIELMDALGVSHH
jgi:hypothetical protein